MPKGKESQPKTAELYLDPNLKNIWVDNIQVAVREDGICCCRLSTSLPEGYFEQIRFMAGKKQIKEFIDILCHTIKYCPEPESLAGKFRLVREVQEQKTPQK